MEVRSSERVRTLVTQMARSRRGLSGNENARALISMMARSKCSNQRPDTLMQDRSPPARRNHLQRTAGPYIGVKLRRAQPEQLFSGVPLLTDIARLDRHVANVPIVLQKSKIERRQESRRFLGVSIATKRHS